MMMVMMAMTAMMAIAMVTVVMMMLVVVVVVVVLVLLVVMMVMKKRWNLRAAAATHTVQPVVCATKVMKMVAVTVIVVAELVPTATSTPQAPRHPASVPDPDLDQGQEHGREPVQDFREPDQPRELPGLRGGGCTGCTSASTR